MVIVVTRERWKYEARKQSPMWCVEKIAADDPVFAIVGCTSFQSDRTPGIEKRLKSGLSPDTFRHLPNAQELARLSYTLKLDACKILVSSCSVTKFS